jgi:hypothetical protein
MGVSMRVWLGACGVLWTLAIVAGCGPSVGATATGLVTFNGTPAPAGVIVTFQPQTPNSSASIGVTNQEGRYDLRFNATIRGVMPGESVVSLSLSEQFDAEGLPLAPDSSRSIVIPPNYGQRSTLVKTVKPGPNEIDIDVVTTK